jgi:hypothetical protein
LADRAPAGAPSPRLCLDPVAGFLVEQMDRAGVRGEEELVARPELVPLLEHHRDFLPGEMGEDQDLGAGRLQIQQEDGRAASIGDRVPELFSDDVPGPQRPRPARPPRGKRPPVGGIVRAGIPGPQAKRRL